MQKRISIFILAGLCAVLAWWLWGGQPTITNYPPKNSTIVALGDSLVAGTGATPGNDFASVLSRELVRPIVNLGVPGDTTADGLARLSEVLAKDPGVVLVLLGGNDYLRKVPAEETFSNLRMIVTELQQGGAMVVLLGVRGGLLNDRYDSAFAALAADTGVIYVPDVLEGLFGTTEFMADAVHPNDAGYAQIAARVATAIEPYVE